MKWIVYLVLSAAVLLGSAVFAIIRARAKYKSGRILDPSKILFIGVILSAGISFIPIYVNDFKAYGCGVFETLLISLHNVIRLFAVDGDFSFIISNLKGLSEVVYKGYTVLFSILFVLAPILTFGFVLSFFKNATAYKRYIAHYRSDVFVFSELNEKSLALAKSLKKNNEKDRFFVFTDVFERDEEESYELVEKAKELGAVCFKKDVTTIDFSFHSKKSALNFFAIGNDESENVSQALKLIERFKTRDNTHVYVFSTQTESEMLLSNAFGHGKECEASDMKIKVRRVNEVQSLITRNLFENGYEAVFKGAADDGGKEKKINALVVGMGAHGTEMTKALAWFCQMDGYRVEINSFDIDSGAGDKFASLCPELMDERFNGDFETVGEAHYKITVHSGVDVDTKSFDDAVSALPETTYVFVALGNDGKNIAVAVKLRSVFERLGIHPKIQAVVYDTEKKEALTDISNFKGQKYAIDFIGDRGSSYSEEVILDSDVEAAALKRHMMWGEESEFWQFDYNYRSSIASAIHKEMKKLCGISGVEKKPDERTPEERVALRILEHRRWNAYMRSEGFVYGGTVEKSGRNDLAKMHNCLVPFFELPVKEQEKDDD